jgi:hypothetical protein
MRCDLGERVCPPQTRPFCPASGRTPARGFLCAYFAIDQKKAFAVRGLLKRLEDARCYTRSDKLKDGDFSLPMPTGN